MLSETVKNDAQHQDSHVLYSFTAGFQEADERVTNCGSRESLGLVCGRQCN